MSDRRAYRAIPSVPAWVLALRPEPGVASMSSHPVDPSELVNLGKRYWLPVYRPRDVVLDHGKGARVWDTQGRDYLDFGAGIAVNALGHQDADLVEALTAQAHKLWHA